MTTYTMSLSDFRKMENSLSEKGLTYAGHPMAHMGMGGTYGQYYIYPGQTGIGEMDLKKGKGSMGSVKIYGGHVVISTNDERVTASLPETAREVPQGSAVDGKGKIVPSQELYRGLGLGLSEKEIGEYMEKFKSRITGANFDSIGPRSLGVANSAKLSESDKLAASEYLRKMPNFSEKMAEFMEGLDKMELTYGMTSGEYDTFKSSLKEQGYTIGEADTLTGDMEIKDTDGEVLGTCRQCKPSPFSHEPPVRYELQTADGQLGSLAQNAVSPQLQHISEQMNRHLESGKKAKVS